MNKDPALKGKRGGNCNRTACQLPDANYWHTGTKAWYCECCQKLINTDPHNRASALSMYKRSEIILDPSTLSTSERLHWKSLGIDVPAANLTVAGEDVTTVK